jgi:hypothetical protein
MFNENVAIGEPTFDLTPVELETFVALTIHGVCAARKAVTSGMHEPRITRIVRQEMDHEQRRLGLRIDIDGESELDDPNALGQITGRIDIRIRYGRWAGVKSIYFGIEAKRISQSDTGKAGLYVDHGVERFVDGSYCMGHPTGMMLGYLLDGSGPIAHKAIDAVLQKRYGSLAALVTAAIPTKAAAYANNRLARKADGSKIELIHLAVELFEAA